MLHKERIVHWSLYFLWTNGLDPTRSDIPSTIFKYISLMSNVAVIVISGLELALNWNGVKMAKVELLPNSCLCFAKLLCLIYYRDAFSKLLDSTKNCWTLRDIKRKHQMYSTETYTLSFKVYQFFIMMCLVTAVVLALKPAIAGKRILPFPGYDICALDNDPCFYSQAAFQAFHVLFQLYPISMGFDGLFFALITIIFVETEMIKCYFPIVVSKNTKYLASTKRGVITLIKHHAFILKLIKDMNYVYTNILFVIYWTTMGSTTFSLYMITRNGIPPDSELLFKYGPYFITLLLQVGLYCASGSILMDQISSVSNVVFSVDWWTKSNVKMRRTLCLVIRRSQMEDKLNVGRLYDLNLVTYIELLRNMLSIYTLLDSLTAKNK